MAWFSEAVVIILHSMETSQKILSFTTRWVLYLYYGDIKIDSKYMKKKIYVMGWL